MLSISELLLTSISEALPAKYSIEKVAGKVRVKIDPIPASDYTVIIPPRAFAMFWLRARPRPTPSLFKVLFSMILVNG